MEYNKTILEKYFNEMYDFDKITIHSEIGSGWDAEAVYMITLYSNSDIITGLFIARYCYEDDYPYELTEKGEVRKLLKSIISINNIYDTEFEY